VAKLESRITRLLHVALGGVLIHGAMRLVDKIYAYLHSPYSRDYGEGCVLMMVQLLDERGSYFLPLRDYPFVHANYPPLFIALVWPFYRIFGPSLWAPRLLSTACALALLGVFYALVRRLGGSPTLALALTGIAACPWFFQTWVPMGRVDMLAFLLSLGGLLAFVGGKPQALTFSCFVLAFFAKQNALLAPAAVLLHLLAAGDFRRFLRAALGFALPLLGVFAILNLATHGELYRHLVTYTAAAVYEWDRMFDSYVDFAAVAWPLFVVIGAAFMARPDRFREGAPRVVFIYWLLNLAALSTIAKAGAAQNYFIEAWLATVLLAAVALPIVAARALTPAAWQAGALLVAALAAHYTDNWAHRLPQAITRPERATGFARLWAAVRDARGLVLSENLAAVVVNRKQVLVEPHGLMLLARTGVFRPERVVRDCEAGAFDLVVAERRFEETPGLGECLESRYVLAEALPPYRLLRPRRQ
jgi:hypothetical protein